MGAPDRSDAAQSERRFRAMGTEVHVAIHGDPALAPLAVAEIHRLEQRWSRFLPDSEVSTLNAHAGSWVELSPETFELVRRAVDAHRLTAGRFDPTILGDLVRAGYDRSFDDLDPQHPASPAPRRHRGAERIELDAERRAARLPAGVGFDPGGIGKGLAADRVAAMVDRAGAAGVLINLGGDLRAEGVAVGGDDWTVGIDPAATGEPLAVLALRSGAVATSTVLRRRWTRGGVEHHHLIDPTTGAPAAGDVVSASVVARTAWQAEVLAKAALLVGSAEGPDAGLATIAERGAAGLLVDRHGGLHPTAGLHRFLVAAAPTRASEVRP